MSKETTIGALLLGAVAGVALLRFYSMPQEERNEFISHLKNRAHDLLDDTEGTLNKVKHHFAQIDTKENAVDKLLVVKNLLGDLFGSERRYLL
ncbi:MAG TPA: hypothetical protein VMY77_05050 [Chitinophagaceae bacterium]|nr:hypothetical protein [Chitinophagaceae bacterium]